ncbi:MAG: transglycosylase, partial [Betaproteobacteria bacterium]|nr:transglycosylase [Betaproteobacteria bacterium]
MKRLLMACLVLAAVAAHGASQDEDFLAAREAFRSGNAKKLDLHARRLQGHILEPYVAYWQLRLRLEDAAREEVQAYVLRYRDTPLSDRLRADWLKVLGKKQQWDLFDAEYPQLVNEDIELQCYALQARLRVSATEALRAARSLWFTSRDLPENCTPLFNALAASHQLSSDDVWARIRLGLEAGNVGVARRVAGYLAAGQAPDGRVLEAIASNPTRYLDKRAFDLGSRAGRETVMFAVHRLARTSPQQAAWRWTRLEQQFSPEEPAYVWGLVAYFGAMRHDPGALAWYARAGDLSDLQLAWKARAALRAGNWQEVLAAIDAMTSRESGEAAWRYWKARALRAQGRQEEANEILTPLAAEFNFYGQLATEELGGRIASPSPAFKPTREDVRATGMLPGIQRALALYRLNLRFEGNREWLWAIRGFDDKQLLTAAEVAR